MSDERPEVMRKDSVGTENMLHKDTWIWLKSLPASVQLPALTQNYPRILNRIALLWINPPACQRYLDELLFNDRSDNRQGFPPKVCLEIMDLKTLVADSHEAAHGGINSAAQDIWGKR